MKKTKRVLKALHWCNYRHHVGKYANKGMGSAIRNNNIVFLDSEEGFHTAFYKKCSTEESLWKKVGSVLAENADTESTPSLEGKIIVAYNNAKAVIKATMEGERINFKLLDNEIKLEPTLYSPKYLRRVELETNSHSFYNMVPYNMGPYTFGIGIRWGKIGAEEEEQSTHTPMPSELFWLKYYQKLKEGYTDETEALHSEDEIIEDDFESDEDDTATQLYQKLIGFAKDAISDFDIEWVSSKPPYTYKQVQKCWNLWSEFGEVISKFKAIKGEPEADSAARLICEANAVVVKLIKIASPSFKRGVTVNSFTAKKAKKISQAIENIKKVSDEWEERIMAMDAVASKPKTVKGEKLEKMSPFGNVEVKEASDADFKHFQDLIASQQPKMTGMLKKVYLLDPKDRREKFETALADADDKTVKEVFHGSVNSNMVSLISSGGPTIHVSAANGRMFGNGSYWSSDFDKSLGYTSYRGSRWSHGDSATAYMLVGVIHYGKPYMIQNYSSGSTAEEETLKGGYDCCHALAGVGNLMRDEIITYDETHSYIEAILEIG